MSLQAKEKREQEAQAAATKREQEGEEEEEEEEEEDETTVGAHELMCTGDLTRGVAHMQACPPLA